MARIKLTDRITNHIVYVNKNYISKFYEEKLAITNEKYTVVFTIGRDSFFSVKETPEEILKLIEEAELPKVTFYNNNVDFSKQKHNSRVQEIIDQAHATEILMQEKDPTYGR